MRPPLVVGLTLAVLFSFTACEDVTTPEDGTDGRSPLETLQAFRNAFNNLDADPLDGLLASDFRFYFDENDVGREVNGYTIPASWNRAIFLTAVENMLESAYSVTFWFDESDVGEPGEDDTEYETGEVDIDLLTMVDYLNGYGATGPLSFGFILDSPTGVEEWLLSTIRDSTSDLPVEEKLWSFGRILVLFYAGDDAGGRTPAETLEALEESFNTYDVGLFKGVLAPGVIFHFDPSNVGDSVGDYEIPESWGYDELTSTVGNVFNRAHSVELTVETANVGDPDEGADEFSVYNVQVNLLVLTVPMYGYQAQGFCDFGFANEGAGSTDDWVITDWWDRTSPAGSGGRNIVPASFGYILAVFR